MEDLAELGHSAIIDVSTINGTARACGVNCAVKHLVVRHGFQTKAVLSAEHSAGAHRVIDLVGATGTAVTGWNLMRPHGMHVDIAEDREVPRHDPFGMALAILSILRDRCITVTGLRVSALSGRGLIGGVTTVGVLPGDAERIVTLMGMVFGASDRVPGTDLVGEWVRGRDKVIFSVAR